MPGVLSHARYPAPTRPWTHTCSDAPRESFGFSVDTPATPDRRAFGHNCKLSGDAVGFKAATSPVAIGAGPSHPAPELFFLVVANSISAVP